MTRAVLRYVQPSTDCPTTDCVVCGDWIVYSARYKPMVVICNVYAEGRWQRVEMFHESCYDGRHGEADASNVGSPMKTRTAV